MNCNCWIIPPEMIGLVVIVATTVSILSLIFFPEQFQDIVECCKCNISDTHTP